MLVNLFTDGEETKGYRDIVVLYDEMLNTYLRNGKISLETKKKNAELLCEIHSF